MARISIGWLMGLLMCGNLYATHFITCEVDAKVADIFDLAVLNDAVTVGDHKSGGVQVAKLIINKVTEAPNSSRGGCGFKVGSEVRLVVKDKEQGKYTKGNLLSLEYKNVGDSRVGRISWLVNSVSPGNSTNPVPPPGTPKNPVLVPLPETGDSEASE